MKTEFVGRTIFPPSPANSASVWRCALVVHSLLYGEEPCWVFLFIGIYLYLYYFVLLKSKRSTHILAVRVRVRGQCTATRLALFLPCSSAEVTYWPGNALLFSNKKNVHKFFLNLQ